MTDNAARKRRADGYEPRFDIDLEYGKQAELFVTDITSAMAAGMVEVKRDGQFHKYGTIYVEYQCRRVDGQWHNSGIRTTDATVWAIVLGDTETGIVMPTEVLKALFAELWRSPRRKADGTNWYKVEETNGSHPTRGLRIPLTELLEWLAQRQRVAAAGHARMTG